MRKELHNILFVFQGINPYLADNEPLHAFNHDLPTLFQQSGYVTRSFMPKFGEINERRNQLHEVIRLSGLNIVIEGIDHPLLIKVASEQAARIQFYFIDNDEYFSKRKGVVDAHGIEYADNDERCIFYARSVIETIRKLKWKPKMIYCSGWMSALVPFYVRTTYKKDPYFDSLKVIWGLDNRGFNTSFGSHFSKKIMVSGVLKNDIRAIADLPVGWEDLMRFAILYSDVITLNEENINHRLINYIENNKKKMIPFEGLDPKRYLELFNSLL